MSEKAPKTSNTAPAGAGSLPGWRFPKYNDRCARQKRYTRKPRGGTIMLLPSFFFFPFFFFFFFPPPSSSSPPLLPPPLLPSSLLPGPDCSCGHRHAHVHCAVTRRALYVMRYILYIVRHALCVTGIYVCVMCIDMHRYGYKLHSQV